MPRLAHYSSADSAPFADGDVSFAGVVDRGEPERVPPGFVSAAVNFTFADGTARTRKGSLLPSAFRAAALVAPLYGVGIFSDPNGEEWMLVAEAGRVVQMRDGYTPRVVAIPANLTGRVAIVQGFDEVLLFRGPDLLPWRWSGVIGEAFEAVDTTPAGDGTVAIENGPDLARRPGLRPIVVNSRMIVPHGRNTLALSDIEDYARYDEAYASFNLSAANDDTLAGLLPIGQGGLLALKDGSIALLSGISAALSEVRLTSVSGAPGCVAGATAQTVGSGVLYLAESGVCRVVAADETRMQADPAPVSAAIERIIRRINWAAAKGATSAVLGEYYFLAVPIDNSATNNAILPLNLRTNAWEGVHSFAAGVSLDELVVTDYVRERRLYAVDFTNARVHLLYEGSCDLFTAGARYEIVQSLTTRAYRFDQVNRKAMRRGKLHFRGWWPSVSLSAQTGAVGDGVAAAVTFTPDRTKYKTFGNADYDPVNFDADHDAPGREDYSIEPDVWLEPGGILGFVYQATYVTPGTLVVYVGSPLSSPLQVGDNLILAETVATLTTAPASIEGTITYAVADSAVWPDGEQVYYRRANALDWDLEQTHQLPLLMRHVGTACAVTFTNTRGRIALTGLELEGTTAQRADTRQ